MDTLDNFNNQDVRNITRKKNTRSFFRSKWFVVVLFSAFITIAGSGYWLLNTSSGLQWLLSTAERISNSNVQFTGVNGTASTLQIDRLEYQDDTVQLGVNQLKLDWSIQQLLSGNLLINEISAELINIHTKSSEEEEEKEAAGLPKDLSLPIKISLKKLQVDEIRIYLIDDRQNAQQPYQSGQPDFYLSAFSTQLNSGTQQHNLTHLSFRSMLGEFKASGHIQTMHPFNLDAEIMLDDSEKWGQTQAALTGSLEQIDIHLVHHNAPMKANAHAQVRPFAQKSISLLTSLDLSIVEFNPAAVFPETPDIPKAVLSLHAKLDQNTENQLAGHLKLKNKAIAPLDQDGLPLAGIDTAVLLTQNEVKLDNLRILFSEDGNAGIISGNAAWHLGQEYGLADLNIDNLNPAAFDTQSHAAKISGAIRLTGNADKQKAEIKLSDDALKLDASVSHTTRQFVLERFNLSHGRSRLTGKGELNLVNDNNADGSQPFRFTGQLSQFNIADFIQAPESSLNAKLNVAGNLSPKFSGSLDYQFERSHLNHQPITGKGQIAFKQPLSITSKANFKIGSNDIGIDGRFGKPGDVLTLNITAPSLEQIGLDMSGFLKAQIDLKNTLNSPSVDFDIDGEKLALPNKQSIDNFTAKGKVHPEALSLLLTANQFRAAEETQFKQLNLKVSGTKLKHTIQTDLRLDEEITVALQADGSLEGLDQSDGVPGWQGHLTHLTITGQVPVELLAPIQIKLSSEQIALRNAQFKIAGGQANIETAFWSPKSWKSNGHFSGIGIHPESDLIPQENILQLNGKWDLQSTTTLAQLNGNIEITRERGDWYFPGELPQPAGLQTLRLNANAHNGRLTGQFDLISDHIGVAKAHLVLPIMQSDDGNLFAPHSSLKGELSVKIPDLSWLGYLTDYTVQTDGQAELHASISGSLGKPALKGKINGKKLSIAVLDLGLILHQGQLAAHFDQSALHIDQLHFLSPYESPPKNRLLKKLTLEDKPGSLNVTGSLGFKESTHQLTVSFDRLYLMRPSHYWMVVSGDSDLQFVNNALDLNGKIFADAGLITQPPTSKPQLADDIIITDDSSNFQQQSSTDEQGIIVNVHASLDLGKQFFLSVAGLEGRLDGKLNLQNDEKQALSVVGSISTHQATYKAYGQDLTVERGIVNFHGPIDDPGLNILAIRKDLEVKAGVEVAGSVRHPKVKLVSTPNVPDTEKLSWIVLGRAPDTSGLDTSLLITAANSIFGGESGGITDRLSDMLGVDEISFRQGSTTSGSSQSNSHSIPGPSLTHPMGLASSTLSSQIGTIGKRLSSRAYLSYERGITATTAGITKLTYSLTPKISVVTQAGEDSAVDLFYTFRFD